MANEKQKSSTELAMEEIQRELLSIQLEEGRARVLQLRSRADQNHRNAVATENSLEEARINRKLQEDACPHRKGGSDEAGLAFGSDPEYAVIKHTLADGEVMVQCQRCPKEWRRPRRGNLSAAEYKEALIDYQKALALPTKNTPSGSQLFNVYPAA